jgi:putative flippase GtrA
MPGSNSHRRYHAQEGAKYVGYWDADLATPLAAVPEFVRVLSENPGVDIVLGARVLLLGRRIDRKPLRHYLGRVFATAASLTLRLPVYDTQCGAKLLRAGPSTRALFEQPFGSRWIFDVEMLARYLSHGGTIDGLYEQTISRWADIGGSKVKPIDFLRAFREMIAIYRNYPLGQPLRAFVLPFTSMFSLYTFAGGLGTIGHYVTMVALVEAVRVPPSLAAVAGAALGAALNYIVNYHMTFGSRAKHRRTLPRFVLVALLGIAISGLGVRGATAVGIHYVLAQVVCTIMVLVVGFILNRSWTFAGERTNRSITGAGSPPLKNTSSAAPEVGR